MIKILFFITLLSLASCHGGKDDVLGSRTVEIEKEEVHAFLSRLETDGVKVDTSDLGIYYIVRAQGEGPLAQAGDTLSLEYAGYLLNGSVFDASAYHFSDSAWVFIFKDIHLIPGFEEGISLMNKGAELDLIIPSQFAYGSKGYGPIGPYTPLLFVCKMRDLKPVAD